MISQIYLQNVDLTIPNRTLITDALLKPVQIVFEHLKISDRTYEQYHLIVSSCVS